MKIHKRTKLRLQGRYNRKPRILLPRGPTEFVGSFTPLPWSDIHLEPLRPFDPQVLVDVDTDININPDWLPKGVKGFRRGQLTMMAAPTPFHPSTGGLKIRELELLHTLKLENKSHPYEGKSKIMFGHIKTNKLELPALTDGEVTTAFYDREGVMMPLYTSLGPNTRRGIPVITDSLKRPTGFSSIEKEPVLTSPEGQLAWEKDQPAEAAPADPDELTRLERIWLGCCVHGNYMLGFGHSDMEKADEDNTMDNMRVPRLRSKCTPEEEKSLLRRDEAFKQKGEDSHG